jgi:hypothetical protein
LVNKIFLRLKNISIFSKNFGGLAWLLQKKTTKERATKLVENYQYNYHLN